MAFSLLLTVAFPVFAVFIALVVVFPIVAAVVVPVILVTAVWVTLILAEWAITRAIITTGLIWHILGL